MECLTKNRLLSEKRFFLNKSNTKWLSIGILPGHMDLNGRGFAVDIRISGDNGKFLSLGQPAAAGLESMISICQNIIMPGNTSEMENSTGLMVNAFPLNNGMCYNIMRNDEAICIGHSSIEGLVQMHEFLKSYVAKTKVEEVEEAFLEFLKHKDVDKMLENATQADIDLHINFADFVQVCMELNSDSSAECAADDDGQPPEKKMKKVQIRKTKN